jgi:hypothetical protein
MAVEDDCGSNAMISAERRYPAGDLAAAVAAKARTAP